MESPDPRRDLFDTTNMIVIVLTMLYFGAHLAVYLWGGFGG